MAVDGLEYDLAGDDWVVSGRPPTPCHHPIRECVDDYFKYRDNIGMSMKLTALSPPVPIKWELQAAAAAAVHDTQLGDYRDNDDD